MTSVRSPAVAGRFYAQNAQALREQIHSCYGHDVGPGKRPQVAGGSPAIRGIVAPHAGLPFSGPVGAHAYAALAASGRPETLVIIGPNHTGIGAPVALPEADTWRTPLGDLQIDERLRQTVEASTDATIDGLAHQREHAAEVQVPFLQERFGAVSILPISLRRQDGETAQALGEVLRANSDDETVIIASSDFTHYEPHEVALERDQQALDPIREMAPDRLIETVQREELSVCGYGAIATMMHAVDGTVKVLSHSSSGETAGSKAEVVSYAAITIEP